MLISTLLQVEVSEWLKATASPRAWLAHQKKNFQLHSKLTQIEGIVKTHLAKINFDREALDMDIRYISEPEKVEAMRRDKIEPEPDLNGNVIVPRYDCVTSHTARRTGITNMYLSHKYTILQMMHVSGHKTQKTFMDYIKLSSEEIADEIASMSKKESDMW